MAVNILLEKGCYYLVSGNLKTLIENDEDCTNEQMEMIASIDIHDIPPGFGCATQYDTNEIFDIHDLRFTRHTDSVSVSVGCAIDSLKWNHPFTVKEFSTELVTFSQEQGISLECAYDSNWCDIALAESISDGCIADTASVMKNTLKNALHVTMSTLLNQSTNTLFSKIFNFPEQHRIVCCQYLMWFGELLNQMGIAATVSAKNDGDGKTFFSVSNTAEATLRRDIEQLFYDYLSLPWCEVIPLSETNTNYQTQLKLQSLLSQVEYFKSQILLKDTIIQLKEATIGTLTQQHQSTQNNHALLLNSMEKDDAIELLDGVIKISEFTWLGLTFSPQKLLNHFSKKKK